MKRNNNQKKGARGGAPNRETAAGMVRMPKQIQFEVSWNKTLRFISNSNNPATAVTFKNLLDSVLFAGTATLGYDLFDFVRVRKVEMWASGVSAAGAQATFQTCTLEWSGIGTGSAGAGTAVSETTVGTAIPLHLVTRPPKGSRAALFQISSTDQAFTIRASGGTLTCIVYVDLEFKNSNDVTPLLVGNAIAAATPGTIYFGGLDGARSAGTVWPSAFLPTI